MGVGIVVECAPQSGDGVSSHVIHQRVGDLTHCTFGDGGSGGGYGGGGGDGGGYGDGSGDGGYGCGLLLRWYAWW